MPNVCVFEENGFIWNPSVVKTGSLSGRPPAEMDDPGARSIRESRHVARKADPWR